MSGAGRFDPGMQPERTRLAWRRTLATLLLGSVVAMRLLGPAFGTVAVAVGVVGVLTCAALWVAVAQRARATTRALAAGQGPPPVGGLLLAMSVTVAAASGCGLVSVALLLV